MCEKIFCAPILNKFQLLKREEKMNLNAFILIFSTILWNFHFTECSECGLRKVLMPSRLIIGGNTSYAGQWPWFASLHRKSDNQFYCGASLINERHLLTGERSAIAHLYFISLT